MATLCEGAFCQELKTVAQQESIDVYWLVKNHLNFDFLTIL